MSETEDRVFAPLWQALLDSDDRSSEEYPDHALITYEEAHAFFLAGRASAEAERGDVPMIGWPEARKRLEEAARPGDIWCTVAPDDLRLALSRADPGEACQGEGRIYHGVRGGNDPDEWSETCRACTGDGCTVEEVEPNPVDEYCGRNDGEA